MADGVRAALERLSAAGLLDPYTWVDSGGCWRVEHGKADARTLGAAIGRDAQEAFVVGLAAAADDEPVDGGFYAYVQSCFDSLQRVQGAEPVPPPVIVSSRATTISEPPVQYRWGRQVIPFPGDFASPDSGMEEVSPDRAPYWLAHFVGCATGIWRTAAEPQPFVLAAPPGDERADGFQLARCFSRTIDLGWMPAYVAAGATRSREGGWPNPNESVYENDPGSIRENQLAAITGKLVSLHATKLSVYRMPPVTLEQRKVSLREGLSIVWDRVTADIRHFPSRWLDVRKGAIHDWIAVRAESVRPGSGVYIRRWGELDAPPAAEHVEEVTPLGVDDGAVGEAWRDLFDLCVGLVDGSELPHELVTLVPKRAKKPLVTDPHRLVPDPEDRPPVHGRVARVCDPRVVGELVLGEVRRLKGQAAELRRQEPEPADAPPEGDVEDGGARLWLDDTVTAEELEARADALRDWLETQKATPVWHIGSHIHEEILRLDTDTSNVADTEDRKASEMIVNAVRSERRRRGYRWLRLLILAVLIGLGLAGIVPLVLVLAVVLLLALFGLFRLFRRGVRAVWRAFVFPTGATAAAIDAAVIRAWQPEAAEDRRRLERRYQEFLDWAQVIGYFLHRPWRVGKPPAAEARIGLDELAGDVPNACAIAFPSDSAAVADRLVRRARQRVFRAGWLSEHAREAIEKSEDGFVGSRAAGSAFDDVGEDGLRVKLVRDLHEGSIVRLVGSAPARAALEAIVDGAVADVVGGVVHRAAGSVALPEPDEWSQNPESLAEHARRVLPSIVAVYGPEQRWRGSAIAVAQDLVATNRHCVEGYSDVMLILRDSTTVAGRVIAMSDTEDLAIVQVTDSEVMLQPVPLGATRDLYWGAPLFTVGYPFFEPDRGDPTAEWGILTAQVRHIGNLGRFLQYNAATGPGASGSAVFNLRDEIVGIHARGGSAYDSDERAVLHHSLAVPVEDLEKLMRAHGYESAPRSLHSGATEPTEEAATFVAAIATPCERFPRVGEQRDAVRSVARSSLVPDTRHATELRVADLATERASIESPVRLSVLRTDESSVFSLHEALGLAVPRDAEAAGGTLSDRQHRSSAYDHSGGAADV